MNLNFKIYGSGDPIIILHGYMGSLDNWQTFAKALSEDYMVITVDQRNHGKSFHSEEFSLELMAEDLKALMESEWIHEAVIMGHSMGGKTAMTFAMMYPDIVEKLIVLDIAPKQYERGHDIILQALNEVPIDEVISRNQVSDVLTKYIDDAGVRLFLMKNLKRKPKTSGHQGYEWKVNLPVLTEQYPAILEQIKGDPFEEPTLFIRGEKSKYIVDDDMDLITSLFPQSKLETVADAGHWVHAEQPKALLQLVREFLAR